MMDDDEEEEEGGRRRRWRRRRNGVVSRVCIWKMQELDTRMEALQSGDRVEVMAETRLHLRLSSKRHVNEITMLENLLSNRPLRGVFSPSWRTIVEKVRTGSNGSMSC